MDALAPPALQMRRMSGNAFPATALVGGTRSRVIRVRPPMVMSGVQPRMVDALPARPGSHVWNASVDVLRRTRRNADTISGAAPDATIGRPAAVRAGARPYHPIGIA
jgi:hypothetical protein